ncbi:MAG: CAP domain-containing protein [Acidimicrobiia bacterium]|nr:CAP domain-containing protein [Acidimicrobiia bacterium]
MTTIRKALSLLAAIAVMTSLAAPVAASSPDLEDSMLAFINAERAANALEPLSVYYDLVDDGRSHSVAMEEASFLHHNPDLGSVTTGWYALGENVGVGPDVDSLHDAFMASPGHAANVLGDYNYVGIGVEQDGPRIWVTVVFMRGPTGLGDAPITLPTGATDVGLVDAATGMWYLRDNDGTIGSFYYGNPGDYPMLGDWDCDGIATPGLYRQSDGYVYLRNSNTQGVADIRFYFGNPDDVPLAGDFNGDGCDSVSVYRSAESRVFIINRLGADEAGLGAADYDFAMGGPGQTVVAGDFDGDGVATAMPAPAGGVTGDWDADGRATLGTFVSGLFTLESAGADIGFHFGTPGWLPVSGHTG